MKKLLVIVLCLLLAVPAYADLYNNGYMGVLCVANCDEWVSLRAKPSTSSDRLAKVNLGEVVYECFAYDSSFIRCTYDGKTGYILSKYLTDDLYEANSYIGTMEVVNCEEWVSLRSAPDQNATRIEKIPLGEIVYNAVPVTKTFTYCMYNGEGGYVLSKYLTEPAINPLMQGTFEQSKTIPSIEKAMKSEDCFLVASYGELSVIGTKKLGNRETMIVSAYDAGGMPVWSYTMVSGEVTELAMTDAFCADDRVFMYNAGYGLVCIDCASGDLLWEECEVNLGASITHYVDTDGTLYIGGYYGPDPVAFAADGTVLWQSDVDNTDIFWLYIIEDAGDAIACTYAFAGEPDTEGVVLYAKADGTLLDVQ